MKRIFIIICAVSIYCLTIETGFSSNNIDLTYSNSPVIRARYTGTAGVAVNGWASAGSGYTYGVYGESDSNSGYGVYGIAAASSGSVIGVYGQSNGSSGWGVYGYSNYGGVYGNGGIFGVFGNGSTYGVFGNGSTYGVYGNGSTYGVFGKSSTSTGYGVYCKGKFKVTGALERNDLAITPQNCASIAVTANSSYPGYPASNAVDGIINRWDAGEWATNGGRTGSITLKWTLAQSISEIWIYDRPNRFDQVYDAYMDIDNDGDGTADHTLHLGMFPYGGAPKKITLTSAEGNTSIKAITIRIVESADTTQNVGLSEIVCYP